jgi:hypothetical protein
MQKLQPSAISSTACQARHARSRKRRCLCFVRLQCRLRAGIIGPSGRSGELLTHTARLFQARCPAHQTAGAYVRGKLDRLSLGARLTHLHLGRPFVVVQRLLPLPNEAALRTVTAGLAPPWLFQLITFERLLTYSITSVIITAAVASETIGCNVSGSDKLERASDIYALVWLHCIGRNVPNGRPGI